MARMLPGMDGCRTDVKCIDNKPRSLGCPKLYDMLFIATLLRAWPFGCFVGSGDLKLNCLSKFSVDNDFGTRCTFLGYYDSYDSSHQTFKALLWPSQLKKKEFCKRNCHHINIMVTDRYMYIDFLLIFTQVVIYSRMLATMLL